jgi:5-methylcytosine-specific restriction protein A
MPNKTPRPCWYPGCSKLDCKEHTRSSLVRPPDLRPSAALRGYGARWRVVRAAFLAAHPICESCGQPATIADHVPSRRELVSQGVANPDADQYLHPLCRTCHNRKTIQLEGGWGHGRGVKISGKRRC